MGFWGWGSNISFKSDFRITEYCFCPRFCYKLCLGIWLLLYFLIIFFESATENESYRIYMPDSFIIWKLFLEIFLFCYRRTSVIAESKALSFCVFKNLLVESLSRPDCCPCWHHKALSPTWDRTWILFLSEVQLVEQSGIFIVKGWTSKKLSWSGWNLGFNFLRMSDYVSRIHNLSFMLFKPVSPR